MDKIKPLKPTLREKKRYVTFKIISKDHKFTISEISDAIDYEFKELYGIDGQSNAGIIFISKKFDKEKQAGIIKINNRFINKLILVLSSIKKIKNNDVIIRTLITSGMIKKAAEKINA